MRDRIVKLVHVLDIYGLRIQFRYRNKSRTNTLFGGILTIITYIVILAYICSCGCDLFLKDKPITSFSHFYETESNITLNKTSLSLFIEIRDKKGKSINIDGYFKLEISLQTTFYQNSSTISTKLNTQNFKANAFEHNEWHSTENYYEIGEQDLTIGRNRDHTNFISIQLKQCENTTDTNCKSRQEIESFVYHNNPTFYLHFNCSILSIGDYLNPIKYKQLYNYKNVDFNLSKSVDMYINKNYLLSDNGFIFSNTVKYNYINFEGQDIDYSTTNDYIISYNIKLSENNYIYYRRYIKLQNFLAEIGGLIKFIMCLMFMISFYYSEIKMRLNLLNDLFEYKHDAGDLNDNVIKNSACIIKKLGLDINKFNRSDQQVVTTFMNLKAIDNMQSYLDLKKKKQLKFSVQNTMKMIFCQSRIRGRDKTSVLLFNESNKLLTEYMDITKILNLIEEFQKLKLVLLNDVQLAMFEFLPKESFSLDKLSMNRLSLKNKRDYIKDYNQLFNTISEYMIRNNLNSSDVDKKLLSFLDDDFKKAININLI